MKQNCMHYFIDTTFPYYFLRKRGKEQKREKGQKFRLKTCKKFCSYHLNPKRLNISVFTTIQSWLTPHKFKMLYCSKTLVLNTNFKVSELQE